MAPQYVVRATKFRCGDESGSDWLGSDEPMWVFTALDAAGKSVRTSRSDEFGDVDSGDTRKFPAENNRNVIWPRQGSAAGASGPIGLSIQLWEIDQGKPEEIKDKTNKAIVAATLAGAAFPTAGAWAAMVVPIVRGQLNDLIADDLMGSQTIVMSAHTLERRFPKVGDRRVTRHHFGGNGGDLPFEVAGGPDYDLFIEVTRVS